MNILKVKEQGNSLSITFKDGSQITCPRVNSNIEYEMVKEWLLSGGVIEPEFTEDEIELNNSIESKRLRDLSLSLLTVEVDGLVFDANETARNNMMAAILSAELIGSTSAEWKMADNTVKEISLLQLRQALAMSILAVGNIVRS
jgi:hypothetical protein